MRYDPIIQHDDTLWAPGQMSIGKMIKNFSFAGLKNAAAPHRTVSSSTNDLLAAGNTVSVQPDTGAPAGTSAVETPPIIAMPFLDFICGNVCRSAGAAFASVTCLFALDGMRLIGNHNLPADDWLTDGDGVVRELCARALEIGHTAIAEAADDSAYTLAAVPILSHTSIRAVMLVGWQLSSPLTPHRLEPLSRPIEWLAALLRDTNPVARMDELSRAVEAVNRDGELDQLVEVLVAEAAAGLGVDHCAMLMLDDRSEGLTPLCSHGVPPAFFRGFASIRTAAHTDTGNRAAATGATVICADLMVEPEWLQYRPLAAPLGLRAVWSAPVFAADAGTIGAFTVYRTLAGVPAESQLATLEIYAALCGVAYDNTRRRRRDGTTTDPTSVMGSKLAGIVGHFPGAVIVVDERGHVVYENLAEHARAGVSPLNPGNPDLAVVQESDEWQPLIAQVLRGDAVDAVELFVPNPIHGTPSRSLRVSAAPLRQDERIAGAIVMVHGGADTAARQELAVAGGNLHAIQEVTPFGIALYDADGATVWANRVATNLALAGVHSGKDLDQDTLLNIADESGSPMRVGMLPVQEALRTGQAVHGVIVQYAGPAGDLRWLQLDATPIDSHLSGSGRVVVTALDITQHKHAEMALKHQATHDSLTGLPNRTWFEGRVEEAVADAEDRASMSLLLLDIDRFREVNDTLGHRNGDLLVQRFGNRLVSAVGPNGIVARLGGDEFGVLMRPASVVQATAMARRILECLDTPFEILGQPIDVDASIGIALFPDHGTDAGSLLRRADIAMYAAKHAHDGFAVYSEKFDLHTSDRLSLLGELRRAIDHEQLFLAYQPQIRISDGHLMGVEALVRWQHPAHGTILPDRFIGLAEGTGAINHLTRWVLNEALRQCGAWRQAGYDHHVSVNLSARNLQDAGLVSIVLDLLLKHQVPPDRLTLEITESAIMSDPTGAMVVLTRLNNMGIQLAIDDFGTGYSSLAYLQRLPTQHIKIDKSFVLRLLEHPNDVAIVKAIIELGHNLGREIVAEGVENETVLALLGTLGCDFAQGYFLSKPIPPPAIDEWIRTAH